MSPSPAASAKPSLRARQRARAKDDILDAVVRVFAEGAGSGAVIEQVAAAAGVSRATLYAHFPGGVDELTEAAYDRAGEQFVAQIETRLRGLADWRARIMTHAEVMAEWGADPHRGVFYNIVGPKVLASAEHTGVGSSATRRLVEAELHGARQLGQVTDAIDPAAVAAMLTACVRVIGVEAARSGDSPAGYLAAFRALLHGLEVTHHAGKDERAE